MLSAPDTYLKYGRLKMNHEQLGKVLQTIRPAARWSLTDDELIWLDESQTKPTQAELIKGLADLEKFQIAAATQKAALLARLGITAEEAKLLIG